jgi:hypothetical protein
MKRVLKIVASAVLFAAIIAMLVRFADQSSHGRLKPDAGSLAITEPE